MQVHQCKICENKTNDNVMIVKEMMFGIRKEFEYFKCPVCGCLQIVKIPDNLEAYYPADKYYSYQKQEKKRGLGPFVHKTLVKAYFSGILPLQTRYIRNYQTILPYLKTLHVKETDKILDVGCGIGKLLQEMAVWGFKHLKGIDPFNKEDLTYSSGVRILKQDLLEHTGKYDLIMMHHSFEHMNQPNEIVKQCHRLLAPDGRLLLRIPVSDSYVARRYGDCWAQIDAPRHFFLHTAKSMRILAGNNRFSIEDIQYDSTPESFILSRLYEMNVPRHEASKNVVITKKQNKRIQKVVKHLNAIHDGDQACFILKKV